MKNHRQFIFLALNIWLFNTLPSLSQSSATPLINRPTLAIGNQGNVVSELQAVLKLLGYYQGKVDGIYSEEVKWAVLAFQKAANLTSTGVVDSITWQTLLPLKPPTNNPSIAVTNSDNNNQNTTTNKPSSNNNSQTNTNKPVNNTPNNTTTTTQNTQNKPHQNTTTKPQLSAENMPLLKEGMSGESVKILQQRLKTLGFFNGTIDGVFGVETLQSVIAVQSKFNLGADGIVGYQTWQVLFDQ